MYYGLFCGCYSLSNSSHFQSIHLVHRNVKHIFHTFVVPIRFGCRYWSIHTNVGFFCEKCSISNSITFITSIAFIYVWMDLISFFFFPTRCIHDNANRSIFSQIVWHLLYWFYHQNCYTKPISLATLLPILYNITLNDIEIFSEY